MATVTVRVPQATHQRLRGLAEKRGRPIGEVIDEAARKLEDADFWAEVNASYERLYADPVARAEYEAEMALWDSTLMDGLEDYPYEGIEELLAQPEPAGVGSKS
ncbi:MAG TPA: hypothetical protein VMP03_02355 [Methylomirabilota bacterium]|nr:hypothetical protein [Methylomirabilota bacterium]